jgi:hypothetical protein
LLGGLGVLLGGGDGLLLGGDVGGIDIIGGGSDVDGGVDGVGQFALASITDPSGHVFVVGDVGGGVNDWVHDGSFGFVLQSTGGGVPVVQLLAAQVVPFTPDAGIDVLLGCLAADVVVLVILWLAPLVLGSRLAHFNAAILSSASSAADRHFVSAFSGVSGRSFAQPKPPLLSFATSAADKHFVNALGSVGGHGPL